MTQFLTKDRYDLFLLFICYNLIVLIKPRQGMVSHVLRFKARLSEGPEVRTFVVSYFLSNDTVKIHEAFTPNTGKLSEILTCTCT